MADSNEVKGKGTESEPTATAPPAELLSSSNDSSSSSLFAPSLVYLHLSSNENPSTESLPAPRSNDVIYDEDHDPTKKVHNPAAAPDPIDPIHCRIVLGQAALGAERVMDNIRNYNEWTAAELEERMKVKSGEVPYDLSPRLPVGLPSGSGSFQETTKHWKTAFGRNVRFEESLDAEGAMHCVHGMVWAPLENLVLKKFKPRAAVLMQMRFDGHLGFPGGMVDDKIGGLEPHIALAKVTEALNREFEEEVNMDLSKMKLSCENYCYTQRHTSNDKMFCHFFVMKLTLFEFENLERRALSAIDFGDEVMGHTRVPLFNMEDNFRGFQAFLGNRFAGASRTQLFVGLSATGLFKPQEIVAADQKNVAGMVARVNEEVLITAPSLPADSYYLNGVLYNQS